MTQKFASGGVETLVGDYQGYSDDEGERALFNYPMGISIRSELDFELLEMS